MSEKSPFIEVVDLVSGYGKAEIVKGVNMKVYPGEITTIIGPNGAGKSTFLKTIAGVVTVFSGEVRIHGRNVANRNASEIAQSGVAYVPQEYNVFRTLSVLENLEMGAWTVKGDITDRLEDVFDIFPDLRAKKHDLAGNLSGGQRQMVAFGSALIVQPKVLLLDEPSAGLSPKLVQEMFDTIRHVNAQGVGILMVEQNAVQALEMSDRGFVLAAGQESMSGKASDLLADAEMGELYLGVRS
jgi:branched-chain amino acid transport system ATP-binding protein/neutral amino acid transport system ATP-binding protein